MCVGDFFFYLFFFVQTCRPEEVLHSLLEIIEDIDPAAISETIMAVVPHFKTGD